MKICVLSGTPHKGGNTDRLLDAFLSGLAPGCSVDIYRAYDMSVAPCLGCGVCELAGECVHDDLAKLHDSLLESDVVVIATPVYYLSFPAPLKAIIDRMQRYFCAQQKGVNPLSSRRRRMILLAAAGAPSERGEVMRAQLRWVLPPLNAELAEIVVAADTDRVGVTQNTLDKCRDIASRL
ncbi:MAG: flavodoxin family protein [Clostridia bacterium]|nr:flavodoxin family protein [Clostridia bacterium]